MQNKHFSFIYCVETLVYERKYPEWETCFDKLGLDPTPITECYSSGYGNEVSSDVLHFCFMLFRTSTAPVCEMFFQTFLISLSWEPYWLLKYMHVIQLVVSWFFCFCLLSFIHVSCDIILLGSQSKVRATPVTLVKMLFKISLFYFS